jgi:catechol 2,3-dioxygenase-like lactoylglutathione lyase family enzyme
MASFLDARHVLAVQDVDASTRYYVDVLGFTRDPIHARRWSFLSRDSVKLMLGECADDVGAAEVGSHAWFIRIGVAGVDELHRELASRGAEVLSVPADRDYGLREFVVRTPDGHRIMFAERIT